jgi:hypothetical protein
LFQGLRSETGYIQEMEYGGNPPAYVNQLLTLVIKLFRRRKGIIINLLFLMLMLKPISSMLLIGITLNNGFIFLYFFNLVELGLLFLQLF